MTLAFLPLVANAVPCPDATPRLFPLSGTEVGLTTQFMILVRPERASALQALDLAQPTLEGGGRRIPLRRDPVASFFRSSHGERVFLYRPVRRLKPGVEYRFTHLPELPATWSSIAQARWTVVAHAPKANLEFPGRTLGRLQCVALSADARVCRITLEGSNQGPVPVLLEGTLTGKDQPNRGPPHTFVDIVSPGQELALHNGACDAEMGALSGGHYAAKFVLKDDTGRTGPTWKTDLNLPDMNEEIGKIPGLPQPNGFPGNGGFPPGNY